jgi:hypothetical protein
MTRFVRLPRRLAPPNWNDMGNGNWAAASDYADKVLTVYNEMRSSAGLLGV